MARSPITHIDEETCVGCGLCVRVCPANTLEIVEGKCAVTGERSIHCGQCAAVCPNGAISLDGVIDTPVNEALSNPTLDTLVRVMKKRRSCRIYEETPVDKATLETLVHIGVTAPSGTNAQKWAFTLVPSRDAMERFAAVINDFYRRLNRLAESRVMRLISKLFMKNSLGIYHRRYYPLFRENTSSWDRERRDWLFHGAVAGIVVSMRPGASCPKEDALVASQNIALAAEAMGLGTCLIGFAVTAMKRDRVISRTIGIPDEEDVHAVIAIGHPGVIYARPAGRKSPPIRYFE
jgi:nitroreductase/NAD-dependent dihydropyrimidine dehydrogenase PreA subunit